MDEEELRQKREIIQLENEKVKPQKVLYIIPILCTIRIGNMLMVLILLSEFSSVTFTIYPFTFLKHKNY